MRALEKVRKQIRGIPRKLTAAAIVAAAAFTAGGLIGSVNSQAAANDEERTGKGPNVYVFLNNYDTNGKNLTGQITLPPQAWYYDADSTGSFHTEFRLGSDRNTSTKADIGDGEKWKNNIRPFAFLGFGKYSNDRIAMKGYFDLSYKYGADGQPTGYRMTDFGSALNPEHPLDKNTQFTDGAGNARDYKLLEIPKISVPGYDCIGWHIEGRLGKHGSALTGEYTSSDSLFGPKDYYYSEADGVSGGTIGKEWLWNEGWQNNDLLTERLATFRQNPFSKGNAGTDGGSAMAFRGTGKGYVIICTPIMRAQNSTPDTIVTSGHDIYFDLNGGNGNLGQDGMNRTSFTYGGTSSYLKKDYAEEYISRYGYTFEGWNTAADGSGSWADENTAMFFDTDITLYAQWKAIEYNMTCDANGGAFSNGALKVTKKLPYESSITNGVGEPVRLGYTFTGWSTAVHGGTDIQTVPVMGGTVYAQWTANDVNVTFYVDGAVYQEKTMKAGMSFSQQVAVPKKKGYVFKGWIKNTQSEEYVTRAYEDMSVYAFFYKEEAELKKPVVPVVKTYTYTEVTPVPEADLTIKADANGGTFGQKDGKDVTTVDCKVKKGAALSTAVQNPTRTGYSFDGWYTGADGGDGASVALNNGTVYAHWKPVVCTVTFSAVSSVKNLPNTQQVDYGYDVTKFAVPTMEGATFAGWSDTPDGDGIVKNVYGDMTLYARFDINTYSITFDANEGRFADDQTQVTHIVQDGSGFDSLDVPTRAGYDFKGWYTAKSAGTLVEKATADQTVYAVWEKTKYTLTMVKNDGSMDNSNKLVSLGEKIGDLPVLTRAGYDFKGWNTSKAGTGSAVTYNTVYDKTENSRIYGVWERHAYTVSFNDGSNIVTRKIYKGDTFGQLPDAKKQHKKFVGWYLGDKQIGPTAIFDLDEDVTVTAKWENGSYTVNYVMNTPDNVEPGVYRTTQLANFDELTTLADAVDTKDGFTFKNWNTAADGSGMIYSAGAQVKNLVENDGDEIALYAQWSENHYNVSFDANKPAKADGAVVTGKMESIKDIAYTSYFDVPDCSYVVSGSALKVCFDGWNTAADGTGDTYIEGDKIGGLTGVDGATVRLYAQWHYEINSENTKIYVGKYEIEGDTIYSPIENPAFTLVAGGYEIPSKDVKIDYVTGTDGARKVVFTVSGEFVGTIEKGFVIGKNPATGDYSFPEDYDPSATKDPNASQNPGTSSDPNASSNPNPGASGKPLPTSTTIGLMTPKPGTSQNPGTSSDPNGGIEVPPGYELVTPPPTAKDEYDYTITYCVPIGSKIENPVFGYKAGEGVDLPVKVTKDGYNFKGWFDNAKFTGSAILSVGPSETGDKLFYAKMLLKSEDPDENGRGDDNGNAPDTSSAPDTSAAPGASSIPGIGDNPFKDNLEPNGGTVNRWDEDWTKDIIKLPTDVTRPGYIFGGWYLDPGFAGNPITEISRVDLINGVKVYAKWIPATYKINYELQGIGKLPDGSATSVTHGTSAKLPIPISDTHNFAGWYKSAACTGSSISETGADVIGDLTYYAKWTTIQKIKGGLIYRITGTKTASLIGTTNRNIKTLKVPKTVRLNCKGKTRTYKVSHINGRAFQGCKKLKKVVIGGNVGVIGIYAFKNCTKLQSVVINGNKLLKIRQSAFSGDKKLKKVVIRSYKVNQIGKRAFRRINKNAKIYVHKRMRKLYSKMIKKKGYQTPKNVKVKAL